MAAKRMELGTNITGEVVGDELILRVKFKERQGKSASGKTTIVASTGGNKLIEGTGGVIAGINLYIKE